MNHLKRQVKSATANVRKYVSNKKSFVFIAIFAAIGASLIIFSQAAAPFAAFEAENANLTSPATDVADGTASGGSAVKFNAAGTVSGNVGPANCQLTQADEACWAATTGVKNEFTADANDRWTQAQIVNDTTVSGHKPSEQLGAWLNGCQQITTAMTAGATASNPYVYKNKRIRGYISVQSSFVKIENVYVEYTDSGWCPQGVPGNGAGCCSAIMTGNDDNQTNATKIRNVQIVDTEVESGAFSVNSGIVGSGMNVQRVNAHGGFIIMGYNNRSYIQDSYLHDVTRADEDCYPGAAVGHFPCTSHGQLFNEYLHKDTLWEQEIDNLAIVHTYAKHSSWTNPIGGSSGGCLCDSHGAGISNVYLSNSMFYGGSGPGIKICGAGINKVVWDSVWLGGSGASECSPASNTSDYSASPWTTVWDLSSPGPGAPGLPNITGSHCTNLKNLSGSPISC